MDLGINFIDTANNYAEGRSEETLRALDDLVAAGKVRYVGASAFAAWQLAHANLLAEVRGRPVPLPHVGAGCGARGAAVLPGARRGLCAVFPVGGRVFDREIQAGRGVRAAVTCRGI